MSDIDKNPAEESPESNSTQVGPAGQGPLVLIDGSHKYTDVFSDSYIWHGNAHHHYVIRRKEKGTPAFCILQFQDGPIKEAGVNGIMDENLIAILIDRLKGFQSGKYACEENSSALVHLKSALNVLKERTRLREVRGVEGTHKV